MEREETLREIAALRHNIYINNRLRLEFLASISKLLRDYGISAEDELLSSLILAVPDELSAGNGAPPTSTLSSREPVPPLAPMPPEAPDEEPVPPLSPEQEPVPPLAPEEEPEEEPVPPVAPE
ncbi:MAG TPA: hypothetical protein VF791_02970 [Pyrinomonadaceae bacterium]